MSNIINIGICISDVEKHLVHHQNGKTYLNVTVAPRKETSKYGETHTVYFYDKDAEKSARKIYCGGGKLITFTENNNRANDVMSAVTADQTDNDTPFSL